MNLLRPAFLLLALTSVLHAQDQIVRISHAPIYPNQRCGIHVGPDNWVWISYVSDSLKASAGYFDGSQLVTTSIASLPYDSLPNRSIESVLDDSLRPWFIYRDGYNSPVRVGYIEENTWHQVESLTGGILQYGFVSDPDNIVRYYFVRSSSPFVVNGKVWRNESLSAELTFVDDPQIGYYRSWDMNGAVNTRAHGVVFAFYYEYEVGILGGDYNSLSLVQLSQPRKQLILQTGSSDLHGNGTLTAPLVIASFTNRILVATRDESWRSYIFEVDTSVTRSWQKVITPLDSRYPYQISTSSGTRFVAFAWLGLGQIYTRLFNGNVWFKQKILVDNLSDSARSDPSIALQSDSTLCIAFVSYKDGQPQLFVARLHPDFSIDDLITSVASRSTAQMPTPGLALRSYPNPFNPSTTISFRLLTRDQVQIRIFNILGQEVAILADELFSPGEHALNWDSHALPSGVYICRLHTTSLVSSIRLVLIK